MLLVRVDTATSHLAVLDLGFYLWAGVFASVLDRWFVFLLLFIFISYTFRYTMVGSCMLCAHKLKPLPVATSHHKVVFSSSHTYPTRSVAVMS